ncbi:predicted protein [Coccidioides posadasii str. Silveira]|uniref:Predicted protein n=2 Tax=Coccidioides posadasii TaxID=199306 RepID=E9CXT7_COCPS|nr:predicted protein [Coccidioides posadasii str. Silveira]KMM72680.1 hypothetical protein CPAG_08974 [Coccidioides posadasii RMSCC 3488]
MRNHAVEENSQNRSQGIVYIECSQEHRWPRKKRLPKPKLHITHDALAARPNCSVCGVEALGWDKRRALLEAGYTREMDIMGLLASNAEASVKRAVFPSSIMSDLGLSSLSRTAGKR